MLFLVFYFLFRAKLNAHSQITKTVKPVLCPSLLCCVNIWANEINDCTAFDWLLLVLIDTPRKTQHKELQYVPVINILIGWPPFLLSLLSTTQIPSPPPVPLQLEVQVLYQISLKKSCKVEAHNVWICDSRGRSQAFRAERPAWKWTHKQTQVTTVSTSSWFY